MKTKIKYIEWAYPTSETARNLGFPKTGCWFVKVENVDTNSSLVASIGFQDKKDPELLDALSNAEGFEPWWAQV